MAERSAAEILRAARKRIEDPERWTTEQYARTESGASADPNEESACKWCAKGAICAELGVSDPLPLESPLLWFLRKAASVKYGSTCGDVVTINDTRGHAAVLALYDRAIELAEAES